MPIKVTGFFYSVVLNLFYSVHSLYEIAAMKGYESNNLSFLIHYRTKLQDMNFIAYS